jgi:ribosome-binding factor A
LAESIRDELTEMIEGELADPRIGLAVVTEVKMAPEMRVAHVFVKVSGDLAEQQRGLDGLFAARSFLKTELGQRLRLRRVPELRFELDRSEERQARLDQLLARDRKRHPLSSPPTEEE